MGYSGSLWGGWGVRAPHQRSLGAAACCPPVMLTLALLMTSSHSEGQGWDFAYPLWSRGVWASVRLIQSPTPVKIAAVAAVVTELVGPEYSAATLTATVWLEAQNGSAAATSGIRVSTGTQRTIPVTLVFQARCTTDSTAPAANGVSEAVMVAVPNGGGGGGLQETRVQTTMHLPTPRLWFPNGYGEQHLYELSVTAVLVSVAAPPTVLAQANQTFGVRDVSWGRNQGSGNSGALATFVWRTESGPIANMCNNVSAPSWYCSTSGRLPVTANLTDLYTDTIFNAQHHRLIINGVPIYQRGTNWLPPDLLLGDATEQVYTHLVSTAAVHGNVNAFRVWGGGQVEPDIFYELCDRYGILLTPHEIPHAGWWASDQPASVAAERRDLQQALRRLGSRPSLVRVGYANEHSELNKNNSASFALYMSLCTAMKRASEIPAALQCIGSDPAFWYQRHGPYTHVPGVYDLFETGGAGGTYGPGLPEEWDEFGSSGASSVATLKHIIQPASALWPIDRHNATGPWAFHNAFGAGGGNYDAGNHFWLDDAAWQPYFGDLAMLAGVDTMVRVSQWLQTETLRYQIQAHRRHWLRMSQFTTWTLNEPFPNAAHGSVVEYFGRTKQAFYGLQKALAPRDASLVYSNISVVAGGVTAWPVWFVSSSVNQTVNLTVVVTAYDAASGRILGVEQYTHANVAPHSVHQLGVFELPPQKKIGAAVLVRLCFAYNDPKSSAAGVAARETKCPHTYTFGVVAANSSSAAKPEDGGKLNEQNDRLVAEEETARPILAGLLNLDTTTLEVIAAGGTHMLGGCSCRIVIKNAGKVPALFVRVEKDESAGVKAVGFAVDDSGFTLMGGETMAVNATSTMPEDCTAPWGNALCKLMAVSAWNAPKAKATLS